MLDDDGMLKIDDGNVIGNYDDDVLLLSRLFRIGAYSSHSVCPRRYWAVIVDESEFPSVLALCAAWTGCLTNTLFGGFGLAC